MPDNYGKKKVAAALKKNRTAAKKAVEAEREFMVHEAMDDLKDARYRIAQETESAWNNRHFIDAYERDMDAAGAVDRRFMNTVTDLDPTFHQRRLYGDGIYYDDPHKYYLSAIDLMTVPPPTEDAEFGNNFEAMLFDRRIQQLRREKGRMAREEAEKNPGFQNLWGMF